MYFSCIINNLHNILLVIVFSHQNRMNGSFLAAKYNFFFLKGSVWIEEKAIKKIKPPLRKRLFKDLQ